MTGRTGLGALYGRLRSAGVEAGDPDELQLKKQVLLFACGLMIAGSAIWLSIYWLLGLPLPATLPVAFQLLSTINSSTGHLCLSCFQYPGERAHSSPLHASLLKVSNMSFSAYYHFPFVGAYFDIAADRPVGKSFHCHFTLGNLLHFLLIVSPSFLLGGAGVYNANGWMLIPWLLILIGYFGFVEIRVMCSHCPHYAEPGRSLTCWANYGALKLWKYRPGQMTRTETVAFFGGFVLVWGYPLVFIIRSYQWFLLIVYALTTASFFVTLQVFLCSQCMNFACPLNRVDDEIRGSFF